MRHVTGLRKRVKLCGTFGEALTLPTELSDRA